MHHLPAWSYIADLRKARALTSDPTMAVPPIYREDQGRAGRTQTGQGNVPASRVLGSLATLRTAMGLAETDREEGARFRDRREDTASEEDREREGATKLLFSALDAVTFTEAMATRWCSRLSV